MNPSQTAIMSLEEPRPRGTVLGESADRRRVSEAENFFRCNICGGYLDARDYVWVLDHEGPLPHPAQDQARLHSRSARPQWCPRTVACALSRVSSRRRMTTLR
jgi:hypothetical protein